MAKVFVKKPGTLKVVGIENEIKPGIFDEKRGIAALLIKNSGFYFVRDPRRVEAVPEDTVPILQYCLCATRFQSLREATPG